MPRGRPPARTRTDVVAAAVAVADTEGLDALTMRRLATELGAGVMSLYTYVRDKDELVDHMIEHVSGYDGPPAPTLLHLAGWQRDLMLRHPWLPAALPGRGLSGPNAIGYLERGLAALAGTRLSGPAKLEVLALLTGFVAGYVNHELAQARAGRTAGEHVAAQVDRLQEAVASGAYPRLAEVLAEGGSGPPPAFPVIAERMIASLTG